jgi:hypothetical protein
VALTIQGANMAFDLKAFLTSGTSTAAIGEPVTALTTQVNRFRKANGKPPLKATPGVVSADLATEALTLQMAQLSGAIVLFPNDSGVAQQLAAVSKAIGTDPVGYVSANLGALIASLRAYADQQFGTGLTAFQWAMIASGVVLAGLGGHAVWRRSHHAAP